MHATLSFQNNNICQITDLDKNLTQNSTHIQMEVKNLFFDIVIDKTPCGTAITFFLIWHNLQVFKHI